MKNCNQQKNDLSESLLNIIGSSVKKISNKPFKSGLKINTVKGVILNEQDPKQRYAYVFNEDDSCVNCDLCEIIN